MVTQDKFAWYSNSYSPNLPASSPCMASVTTRKTTRERVAKTRGAEDRMLLDCEQSLFFFRFSKGSARACERWAAKPWDTRNEGGAFSHARGHLRVSGVLLDGPRKKRDFSSSRMLQFMHNSRPSHSRLLWRAALAWLLAIFANGELVRRLLLPSAFITNVLSSIKF